MNIGGRLVRGKEGTRRSSDTAMTLKRDLRPDILLIRHSAAGAAATSGPEGLLCSVINAGDGAMSTRPRRARTALTSAARQGPAGAAWWSRSAGDVLHSRVARSNNSSSLNAMGAQCARHRTLDASAAGIEKMAWKRFHPHGKTG